MHRTEQRCFELLALPQQPTAHLPAVCFFVLQTREALYGITSFFMDVNIFRYRVVIVPSGFRRNVQRLGGPISTVYVITSRQHRLL